MKCALRKRGKWSIKFSICVCRIFMWVLFSKHAENPAPSMYQPTRASHLCVIFGQSTRNSSDRFDGKKGAVIPFCRFSTEGLEIEARRPKVKWLPTRRMASFPSGWLPSACPSKLSTVSSLLERISSPCRVRQRAVLLWHSAQPFRTLMKFSVWMFSPPDSEFFESKEVLIHPCSPSTGDAR